MSQVEEMPEQFMPDENDVESSGGKSWRFAKGKIVRGPKDKTEERSSQTPTGYIKRIGIHDDVTNDEYQNRYVQFEVDFQTQNGIESFHASLWNSERQEFTPSGSAVSLARVALKMLENPQQCYRLTVSKGADWKDEKTGLPREGTTYVNLAKVVQKDGKSVAESIQLPANTERKGNGARWAELEPLLKASSLYKERPKRASTKLTHYNELVKEMVEKCWPTPETSPEKWLALMNAAFTDKVRAALSEYTEDHWGTIRGGLKQVADCPPALRAEMNLGALG